MMSIHECIVVNTLKRLGGTVDIERLVKYVFLIDRLGGLNAFTWDKIDFVLTSNEFLSVIERLCEEGVITRRGGFVSIVKQDYRPNCGWFETLINRALDYVMRNYGGLNDAELNSVVEFLMEEGGLG